MLTQEFREYSVILEREMPYRVYGKGGKLCLAFPSQGGRFYDFENFGMVESLRPWLDDGRLTLVCPDSIDGETWSRQEADSQERIQLHERWFQYVIQELLPREQARRQTTGKAMVTGCSMGGFHAGNFFFRRPDLFDTVISLSGLFHADYFLPDYMDPLVYENSSLHFLLNMPQDHPWISLYRSGRIILCCGQGAWEEDLLASTRRMDRLLRKKEIPAWVDYWGYDVSHDWCWWQKQLPYFIQSLIL